MPKIDPPIVNAISQDEAGVDLHGLALEHGREDVALELLHQEHDAGNGEGGLPPVADQDHQDCEYSGGHRPDDRDEAGKERDDSQRQGQWHPSRSSPSPMKNPSTALTMAWVRMNPPSTSQLWVRISLR